MLADFRDEDTFTFAEVTDRFTDFLARLRSPADRTLYLHRLADRIADGNRKFANDLETNFGKIVEDKRRLLLNRSRYNNEH